MFIMLIGKTCPGHYEIILNSYNAVSFINEFLLLFSNDLVICPATKLAELTLSSDLALKFLPRPLHGINSKKFHRGIEAMAVAQLLSR